MHMRTTESSIMSDLPSTPQTISLSLAREEAWTLHHVLLDRIERESATDDPPPVNLYRAFESLDTGSTQFTTPQLAVIRSTLSTYHHDSSWWEIERPQVECLLQKVCESLEQHSPAVRAE